MAEIKLPEAKPAYEWVNGRALQKVSPKRKHAMAQTVFVAALDRWARTTGAGVAGTEWRFRIAPPGEVRRPLVPDVAFLSYKRLPYKAMEVTDEPRVAPDAVIEVQSPGDRPADIAEKVRVYLASGTHVVFLVDPGTRIVTVCDARGEQRLNDKEVITHAALSGFRLAVKTLFELPRPK
ncbi:MAG TPA: Uma2 family endonuclease [Candidatus Acidoferrales bacterium]|nr:Uma2 family endonuclease [Candidatus Acidoferrales bacterium]